MITAGAFRVHFQPANGASENSGRLFNPLTAKAGHIKQRFDFGVLA
jgi:hypothetical protein